MTRSDEQTARREKAWARMIAAETQWRSEKEAGNVMGTAVAWEHYQNMLREVSSLHRPAGLERPR